MEPSSRSLMPFFMAFHVSKLLDGTIHSASKERKKPFDYLGFIRSIYPGARTQEPVFALDRKAESKWAKKAIENGCSKWKGIGRYKKSPAEIYLLNEDEAKQWIEYGFVRIVLYWLEPYKVSEIEGLRFILEAINDSLSDRIDEKSLFYRSGTRNVTIASVTATLFEFLRYKITGETPKEINLAMCKKFEDDKKELSDQLMYGASEEPNSMAQRLIVLRNNNNSVALYNYASSLYYTENRDAITIDRTFEVISMLLKEYSEYPMAHYLKARVYLDYALGKNSGNSMIQTEYERKDSFYETIVDDAVRASKYGIGGGYEILGDLIGMDDCPDTVKATIGDALSSVSKDTEEEYSRRRRHMYRFGKYCGNAYAAYKLYLLLQEKELSRNCVREKEEALKMASDAGVPEACKEYTAFYFEQNARNIMKDRKVEGEIEKNVYREMACRLMRIISAQSKVEKGQNDFFRFVAKSTFEWNRKNRKDCIDALRRCLGEIGELCEI